MKIDFIGKDVKLSDHFKDIAEQKFTKLDKYFNEPASVKITLKKEGKSQTTEAMLNYCGKLVRATYSSDNYYDNLDKILPKMEGQIRKYHTHFDKNNKMTNAYKDMPIFDSDSVWEKKTSKLVKEKSFTLTPMTVEEAEQEMELLGHSFYVFLEIKSHTVQVLYKRNDGDLGLIEPVI